MHQKINYKGLTRLPSDVSSFNGEMEDIYNLFNLNGELRPYLPPEQMGTLSGVLKFVHKNQHWENFITLDGSVLKAYKYNNDSFSLIGVITNIYGEELIKIDSIGNTLIILTDKEIKYALWKETSYKYIGSKIPFPNISFRLRNYSGLRTPKYYKLLPEYSADIKKLDTKEGFNPRGSGSPRNSPSSTSFLSADFENEIFGSINSRLQEARKNGSLLFPFFVRYAVRLYDGSLILHSQPFLMLPSKFVPFHVSIASVADNKIAFNFLYGSMLTYSYEAIGNISNFADIIESVDIFMSAPIYSYIYDANINGLIDNPDYIEGKTYPEKIMGGFFKSNDEVVKEISSTSTFYKILSIPIKDFESHKSTTDIKVENFDTLVTKERMTDDYLTHDTISAKHSFSYNHRLHLSGISRSRFNGFKLWDNECSYDGTKQSASIDIGAQPFIFYPNAKCGGFIMKQKFFNQGVPSFRFKRISLSEHEGLNGSFYLDPNLNNIENDGLVGIFEIPTPSAVLDDDEYNKLYVSAINNPFLFPVNSRVTLPVGRIIAVSSNTQAISAGQFGQFPLYAFTDDGIWALEVSSEGKYLARQPISREVAINANILQMDNYIAFISKRGLNILSGSSTECISEIVREMNTRSSKVSITSFIQGVQADELQQVYNTLPIEDYMKDCDLAYEHLNGGGRIYMINNRFNYCYIFDILSKSWSKVQGSYRNSISNYPDCYVQNESGGIFNLASLPLFSGTIPVFFMSRPIRQEQALFTLRQLAHNGLFSNLATCIYGSRDGINYTPVLAGTNKVLRIGGSPYRYYKISVIGNLKSNHVLSSMDITLETRFDNKLR